MPSGSPAALAPPSTRPYIHGPAVALVCGPFAPPSAAGRFHRTLSAYPRRLPAYRAGLAARNEARRLPDPRLAGQGERVDVWSRRGVLFNDRFPNIAEAVGALPVRDALIDGEAVTFLPDGHSDFAALRTKEGGEQASFVAFDLLDLKGDDLRDRPLEERREALARIVNGAAGVRFSEALSADGVLVFAHACKLGLEGPLSQRNEPQLVEGPEPGV